MTQGQRVTIEYFLPPVLASLPFAIPGIRDPELSPVAVLFASVAVGFMGAGLPSLVSTFILERAFSRGLDPKEKKAVGLSALLGLLESAETYVAALKAINVDYTKKELRPAFAAYVAGFEEGLTLLKTGKSTTSADAKIKAAHQELVKIARRYD
jgi:hypothetical protein